MSAATSGSYRLAEQIGGWAVYADLTISVAARDRAHPLVTLAPSVTVDAPGPDLAAISFGAVYAFGFVRNSDRLGVIVHRLHTNPVDTTPMALAFATCHAVFQCLQISPTASPYFDRSTKSFVFPGRGVIDG